MINKIILKFLKISIIIVAVYFLLSYLFVVFKRIAHPFELELYEGIIMDHCIRVFQGKTLYPAPNAEFIPLIYPPLYFWVSAFFMKILGLNFSAARIVSVLSSFLVGFLIFKIVKNETKNNLLAFISSSLFFASYKFTCAWFDIARVDSLFIALIILSIYILKYYKGPVAVVSSGLLLSAAFFTKQFTVFFIFTCAIYLYFSNKKKFFLFFSTIFATCLGIILTLNFNTKGWFLYYIFYVPSKHSISKISIIDFLIIDLICLSFILIPTLIYHLRKRKKIYQLSLMDFSLIASFFASFSARINIAAVRNSLIPLIVFSSISFGISINKLNPYFNSKTEIHKLFLKTAVYLSILFQFALFSYNPKFLIPSTQNYIAGKKFIKKIKSIEGNIFIPKHGFYSTKAGKRMNVHYYSLLDSIYWFKPELFNKKPLPKELLKKIKEKEYTAILLDSLSSNNPLNDIIKKHYFLKETIFEEEEEKYSFPNYIYYPKE